MKERCDLLQAQVIVSTCRCLLLVEQFSLCDLTSLRVNRGLLLSSSVLLLLLLLLLLLQLLLLQTYYFALTGPW